VHYEKLFRALGGCGGTLEDVKNVSKRTGVMVNGRWLTEEELQQRLTTLRAGYQH
jgi:hypothetical protein